MLKNKLIELRKAKKLRQEDIANILGIARTTYAMYEQGNREPDFDTLNKIADYFEVTIDHLLGREEKVKTKEDSLEEVNKLVKEYGIEQFGFFDIEKWKDLSHEDIEEIKKHFEYVVFQAKQRNEK
ncbi:helix-turn-helix transcriptional regulator [Rossellomorea sp. DA94]|uniref:helix-turn-helix domain-containing protein n=1 Tax=Rossellomorea sp. DA94 TaxID=3038653 RepID=UPI002447F3B6|nr:helix-turn-helix transcriptional regulator [Rossellomorea sp. DA94]WGG44199.1 helix-turn-helix transcriptional regulator [Rossellomorea sp. DA94]